ncbi:hypothetical protein CJ030_MR8G002616 [Morella rubra]|nr:hypothetical protein CJ030_MR8G002616 [Morella rubra]
MAHLSLCCNILTPPALPWAQHPQLTLTSPSGSIEQRRRTRTAFAAKSGGFSLNPILKGCQACGGKGAIECPGCKSCDVLLWEVQTTGQKGTGKNKKNGNIFERWKCFDCQGFGLKSCPTCGKGGLTPEQRGER